MLEITMWQLLFFGIAQAVLIALAVRGRVKGVKLIGPLLMWKSKRGLQWIELLSKKYPRFWKAYADFGVILAFGVMGALWVFRKQPMKKRIPFALLSASFLLAPYVAAVLQWVWVGKPSDALVAGIIGGGDSTFNIIAIAVLYFGGFSLSLLYLLTGEALKVIGEYLSGMPAIARVGPALPGIDVEGSPISGIPWYGWLAFPILLFVHEASHGVLTRLQNLKLKSTGVLMLGVIPMGAFVEPDEKQLKNASIEKQLRVFSVGSTANYLTAFIVAALIFVAVTPVFESMQPLYDEYFDHPEVLGVLDTSDAYGKLVLNSRIISINGTVTKSIADVHDVTEELGAFASVEIVTTNGTFISMLDSGNKIGISSLKDTMLSLPQDLQLFKDFVTFLGLVVFFNFIVGVMNLIPLYPLDGGHMTEAFLTRWHGRKKARHFTKLISYYVLLLFLVNILPLFFPNH